MQTVRVHDNYGGVGAKMLPPPPHATGELVPGPCGHRRSALADPVHLLIIIAWQLDNSIKAMDWIVNDNGLLTTLQYQAPQKTPEDSRLREP